MATITTRRLDSNWDAVFTNSASDMLTDEDAVVQLIEQTLRLFSGEWWESRNLGTNWIGNGGVLGSPANGAYQTAASDLIRSAILSVPGVTGVPQIAIDWNPSDRSMSISYSVTTEFGTTVSSTTNSIQSPTAVIAGE